MKYWQKRTNTGRVVYKRKKHHFEEKDIYRIMEKLETKGIYLNQGQVAALFSNIDYMVGLLERIYKVLLTGEGDQKPILEIVGALFQGDIFEKIEAIREIVEEIREMKEKKDNIIEERWE